MAIAGHRSTFQVTRGTPKEGDHTMLNKNESAQEEQGVSTQSPLTRNEARSISYRTLSGENANSWFCFDIGLAKYKGCPFQSLFRTNRRMKLHAVSKKGTHGIQQGHTPLTIFWVITGHRSRLVLMRVSSWILQIHFSPNFDSPSDTLQTEKYEHLSKK